LLFFYDLWSINQSLTWTLIEKEPRIDVQPNSTFLGSRSRTNFVFLNSSLICIFGGFIISGFEANNTQNSFVKVGDTWCSNLPIPPPPPTPAPTPEPTPAPTPSPINCNNTFLNNSICTSNSSVTYNGTLNNNNVINISTYTVTVDNYVQNGSLITSGGSIQVLGNATINGNIYIIISGTTSGLILLVNSSQLNLGNITVTTLNGNTKCTKVTATIQPIGNQLYALLSDQSTCNNNNDLIIGISVGVGGALLLLLIITVIVLLILNKYDKLPKILRKEKDPEFASESHVI